MSKNYYEILGVNKNSSEDEIKKAFRKKAHQHHPDKKGGDDKKFKEINEAYNTLSNPKKKSQYDSFGSSEAGAGFNGGGGNSGFGDFDFSGFQGQGGGGGFDFSDLFGGGFGGRREKSGQDIEVELEISFKDSVFGIDKVFNLKKNSSCSSCDGNGAEKNSSLKTCATCSGHGIVNEVRQTMMGAIQTQKECPKCKGSGKIPEKKCSTCSGSGIENRKEEINVRIPAGVENGNRLRVSGKGEAIANGVNGDLHIYIKVGADKNFKKDGNDLYSKLKIDLVDAVLGSVEKVKTIDGEIKVKIPEGTQSGKILKIKNEGVVISGNSRGNLFLEIVVKIPQKLSRGEKKLFEELRGLK